MNRVYKVLKDDSGQGLVEYSLIITLIAIAVVSAVIIFGESVTELYERIEL